MKTDTIKVFIIEDSALTRAVLEKIIDANPKLEVVGSAINPIIASKKILNLKPDVITLDLILPDMDGLTFLKKIRKTTDIPVIVISGNSPKSSKNALKALELGALEIIEKPDISSPAKLEEVSDQINRAIISAHLAKKNKSKDLNFISAHKIEKALELSEFKASKNFFVLGSSTGGPELNRAIFKALNPNSKAIVVAQHMPEAFTHSYAERLDEECAMKVDLAKNGDRIVDGKIFIIPGNHHGNIQKDANGYFIELNKEEKVNRHRPSVDVLFSSAAKQAGSKATGIILTGMGNDGAQGMLEMLQNGSTTIVQDEESSVVYGMPKQAKEIGAAKYEMNPQEIVDYINNKQSN